MFRASRRAVTAGLIASSIARIERNLLHGQGFDETIVELISGP